MCISSLACESEMSHGGLSAAHTQAVSLHSYSLCRDRKPCALSASAPWHVRVRRAMAGRAKKSRPEALAALLLLLPPSACTAPAAAVGEPAPLLPLVGVAPFRLTAEDTHR